MVSLLTAVVVVVSSIAAAPNAAQWQADYGKALAATRSDDRPLLVVLDVPSDPEAAVESEQLEGASIDSGLLDSYQRCHVDVSTEYGKKVAKAFGAEKFPFTAIIDKTGSVVLCKKTGQLSDEQWENTLLTYKSGERQSRTVRTTYFRGDGSTSSPSILSPSYCPSCQLRAQ